MSVLRLRSTAEGAEEVRLELPRLTVGREPGTDLHLPRNTVSKVHAIIALVEGVYRVRDAGSTNGTRVNGKEAADWLSLRVGDEISFGPSERWVVEGCPAPRAPQGDPTVRAEEGAPILTVWSSTGEEGTVRIHGREGTVDLRPPANRFKALYVLAAAAAEAEEGPGEAWVDDDLLRARIWTRVGARDRSPQALNVLLSYTRRLLEDGGLPGTLLEKDRGKTRLHLASGQVRVLDVEFPGDGAF